MFFVYVIFSEKFNRNYTGLTNNLERRLNEHNKGLNRSTKAYIPWKLIHVEKFENRIEARNREKYIKSGIGREYIKNIIAKMAQ